MNTENWQNWDKKYCFHPFTQQLDWKESKPLILVSGKGIWLKDSEGNRYIDANSSIWTNIHGHSHPEINNALIQQIKKISHSSYLGFGNPRASELAKKLISYFPEKTLTRVFFSDDGSTAIESAIRMSLQYRQNTKENHRRQFVAFSGSYHGDTLGSASLGGISRFFSFLQGLGVKVRQIENFEQVRHFSEEEKKQTTALIIEPLIQGVNEMRIWDSGLLQKLREWTKKEGIHLILDEVMTGFGRTGTMFACQQEKVIPDFLCLAKGLTGGYLPLATTLITEEIYSAFLGKEEEKTFSYGHSYTANQLGCAAALASLEIFEKENLLPKIREKSFLFQKLLAELKDKHPQIYEIRQKGLIAGIEIRDKKGNYFPNRGEKAKEICLLARKYQILTRPICDTIVLMPPLCISQEELSLLVHSLSQAIQEIFEN